jgi:hypothetical protein
VYRRVQLVYRRVQLVYRRVQLVYRRVQLVYRRVQLVYRRVQLVYRRVQLVYRRVQFSSLECNVGDGKENSGSTIHCTAERMRVGKNDFSPWVYLVLSKTKLQNTQDSICTDSTPEPRYIPPSVMALSVSHWHFQNLTTGLCLSRREQQA